MSKASENEVDLPNTQENLQTIETEKNLGKLEFLQESYGKETKPGQLEKPRGKSPGHLKRDPETQNVFMQEN